jgi:hypothetical protein
MFEGTEARRLRLAAAQTADRAAGLGPGAPLLAMALYLAPDVLGELVDRVEHVRRGLLGVKRGALEMQVRLRDGAVGDRRVLLLPQDDFELGEVGDLWCHPGELLRDPLANLVGDLGVATVDLDSHGASCLSLRPCVLSMVRRSPRLAKRTSEGGGDHRDAAGLDERVSAGRERRPGRQDVVDEQGVSRNRPGDDDPRGRCESFRPRPADLAPTIEPSQACRERQVEVVRDLGGEQAGRVEAASAQPASGRRDRDHGVVGREVVASRGGESTEG